MSESNAIGWIGLILLVVAIGIASMVFGSGSSDTAVKPAAHAAK